MGLTVGKHKVLELYSGKDRDIIHQMQNITFDTRVRSKVSQYSVNKKKRKKDVYQSNLTAFLVFSQFLFPPESKHFLKYKL